MLDIKYIRENKEKVQQSAKNKGVDVDIVRVLQLDEKRRSLIAESESVKAQQNKLGKDNIEEARAGCYKNCILCVPLGFLLKAEIISRPK